MNLLLIACFSLFSFLGTDYVPQEKKDSLILVAQPESKNVCVALIDGKPYLIEFTDVQLLQDVTEKINIYGKESDEYKKIKHLYPKQTQNLAGVIVIKLQKGATFPQKFTKHTSGTPTI